MEQQLEVASRAVKGLAAALDDYEAAQEALRESTKPDGYPKR